MKQNKILSVNQDRIWGQIPFRTDDMNTNS